MRTICSLMILAAILLTQTAVAQPGRPGPYTGGLQPGDPVANDVYVQLYLARSDKYGQRIFSAANNLDVSTANLVRVEHLVLVQAMCTEEAEEYRLEHELNQVKLKYAKARSAESNMVVDIAIARILAGREMPICADTN